MPFFVEPSIDHDDWKFVGCFKRTTQNSPGIPVDSSNALAECQQNAVGAQFALTSEPGTGVSCHIGPDLTSGGLNSGDPCEQVQDSEGHAYGDFHRMAVYEHLDGTTRYKGCFRHDHEKLANLRGVRANLRGNIQIAGLLTWSQCEQKAIDLGKSEFVLENKIGSRATCFVGSGFTNKGHIAHSCTQKDNAGNVYGDPNELAVYERSASASIRHGGTTTTSTIIASTVAAIATAQNASVAQAILTTSQLARATTDIPTSIQIPMTKTSFATTKSIAPSNAKSTTDRFADSAKMSLRVSTTRKAEEQKIPIMVVIIASASILTAAGILLAIAVWQICQKHQRNKTGDVFESNEMVQTTVTEVAMKVF